VCVCVGYLQNEDEIHTSSTTGTMLWVEGRSLKGSGIQLRALPNHNSSSLGLPQQLCHSLQLVVSGLVVLVDTSPVNAARLQEGAEAF